MTLIFGFLLGLTFSPLIEMFILNFLTKKKSKPVIKPIIYYPTNVQYDLYKKALNSTPDLNWINLLIQRYWLELSNSYAYKDKLKRTFLKKIQKVEKYVQIKFEAMELGDEFPIFEKIKVLSENEYLEIMKNKGKVEKFTDPDTSDPNFCDLKSNFSENIGINNLEENKDINMNNYDNNFASELESLDEFNINDQEIVNQINSIKPIFEDMANETIEIEEPRNQDLNFNHIKILAYVHYRGSLTFKTKIKLPKITIPFQISISYMKGPVLMRFPALLNHTRYEFSLLNIDKLEFKVECNYLNKYIKKAATKMMHNYFIKIFKANYVYPSFYPQYLPNVIPSMREVDYKWTKIETENEADQCLNELLLFMSMDFKVMKVANGIVTRKGNYYVNKTKEKLDMSDINIAHILCDDLDEQNHEYHNTKEENEKNFTKKRNINKDDKSKNEGVYDKSIKMKKDDKSNVDNPHVGRKMKKEKSIVKNPEDMGNYNKKQIIDDNEKKDNIFCKRQKRYDQTVIDNFFNLHLKELSLFKKTIGSFLGLTVIKEFKNYTKVKLIFTDNDYIFNRIIYNDCIIFQSDSSNEFFSFRIRALQLLEIFSYVSNKDYKITENRVLKFKRKIEESKGRLEETNDEQKIAIGNRIDFCNKIEDFVGNNLKKIENAVDGDLINILTENSLDDELLIDVINKLKVKDIRLNEEIEFYNQERIRFNLFFDTFKIMNKEYVSLGDKSNNLQKDEDNDRVNIKTQGGNDIKNVIKDKKHKEPDFYVPDRTNIGIIKNPDQLQEIHHPCFIKYTIQSKSNVHEINSYYSENFIIDLLDDKLINIFYIKKPLKLFYNKDFPAPFFNSFIFHIKAMERILAYKKDCFLIEEKGATKKFEKSYNLHKEESILFSFESKSEFDLMIYNKSKKKYEFELKLTGKNELILPLKHFLVYLKGKDEVKIKISQNENYSDERLININLILKKKLKIKYEGGNCCLFWDFDEANCDIEMINKDSVKINGSGLIMIKDKADLVFRNLEKKVLMNVFLGFLKIDM